MCVYHGWFVVGLLTTIIDWSGIDVWFDVPEKNIFPIPATGDNVSNDEIFLQNCVIS